MQPNILAISRRKTKEWTLHLDSILFASAGKSIPQRRGDIGLQIVLPDGNGPLVSEDSPLG
jgi:hypothetical protein